MPADPDQFDFFVSCARRDNAAGWVNRFVEELLAEHRRFTGNDPIRELKPFFDKQDIRSFDDWQHRIHLLTTTRLAPPKDAKGNQAPTFSILAYERRFGSWLFGPWICF